MLRGDIYCVLTSQATPLSVGRSFLLMPLFFTGVAATSSRNNSSSSKARGGLTLGGLIEPGKKTDIQYCHAIKTTDVLKRLGL